MISRISGGVYRLQARRLPAIIQAFALACPEQLR